MINLIRKDDAYQTEKGTWSRDVENWATVTYPDIVNFLLYTASAYALGVRTTSPSLYTREKHCLEESPVDLDLKENILIITRSKLRFLFVKRSMQTLSYWQKKKKEIDVERVEQNNQLWE